MILYVRQNAGKEYLDKQGRFPGRPRLCAVSSDRIGYQPILIPPFPA